MVRERKPLSFLSLKPPDEPEPRRDLAGLAAERERAVRALEETRRALVSGEIARAAEAALEQVEASLTGRPEESPGVVTARVVAIGDRKARPIPLGGVGVRLKVNNRVVSEARTNEVGLATIELGRKNGAKYELEALAPDCTVLACQPGVWDPDKPGGTHLFELPRTKNLRAPLERARPFDEGLRKAHERAQLARDVAVKALEAQERHLEKYVATIDAELAGAGKRRGTQRPAAKKPAPRRR
jgi:hypothetical protein